jgi:simple sugar transport system permease protein
MRSNWGFSWPVEKMTEESKIQRATQILNRAASKLTAAIRAARIQIVAVTAALVVGALVILATGHSPIEAYGAVLVGAFGDIYGIGQTLTQATPIIFTALAFLLSFKCGLFNIGAEGQLLIGGFAAAVVGISFSGLPIIIHAILAVLTGAAGGALWGFIPAALKAKLGAHEVITTMMLNYVALYLTSYMVAYPLKAPGWVSQTVPIAPAAELPRILPPTQLSAAFILAIVAAWTTSYLLDRTTIGYEVRAIGLNPTAAQNAGINVKKGIVLALVISGAIAGLGGAGEILGVHRRFIDGFSPGYGWDGLAVALIGGLDPMGAVIAAVFFGALRSGGMVMNRATGVPFDIILVLQALIVLFVAAPRLIKYVLKKGGFKW